MSIRFDMTGKLSISNDTENVKGYEQQEYPTGWVRRTLRLNVVSGDNRFWLQVNGGCFKDGHNNIYCFTKPGTDSDGNRVKGERVVIPFRERLTSKSLPDISPFNKFIVDLEIPGYRRRLGEAITNLKEGRPAITDEFGTSDLKQLEKLMEQSQQKKREFISEWDYAQFLYKMLSSDKYRNKKFHITGNYVSEYSDTKNVFYWHYRPNRIFLAGDDAEEHATANVDFYYGEGAVEDDGEKSVHYINGYTFDYNSQRKKNIAAPYQVVVPYAEDEKDRKREEVQLRRFQVDDDRWYRFGCVVNLLNGSQRTSLKYDDLTDEQKDSILIGETTLAELQREIGGVYGERVTQNVFVKPARNWSTGREETAYTDDDFKIHPVEEKTMQTYDPVTSEDDLLFDF